MGDVGLAGFALLPDVHPRRVIVGAAHQRDIRFGVVGEDPLDQTVEVLRGGVLMRQLFHGTKPSRSLETRARSALTTDASRSIDWATSALMIR